MAACALGGTATSAPVRRKRALRVSEQGGVGANGRIGDMGAHRGSDEELGRGRQPRRTRGKERMGQREK